MFQRDINDTFINFLNGLGYMPILVPKGEIVPPAVYTLDTTRNRYKYLRQLSDLLPPGIAGLHPSHATAVDLGNAKAAKKGGQTSVKLMDRIMEFFGASGTPKLDLNAEANAGVELSFQDVTVRKVAPDRIKDALNANVKPDVFGEELKEGFVYIAYEYLYSSKIKIESGMGTAANASGGVQVTSVVDISVSGHTDSTGKEQRNYQGEKPVAFAFAAAKLTYGDGGFALIYDDHTGAALGPGIQVKRKIVSTGQVFDFTE